MTHMSEFDRADKMARKAEKARFKQEAKGYPKCAPWKHRFKTISMSGLGSAYLDRCERCLWWKEWGMLADMSWSQMHPPSRYQEEYEHYLEQQAKLEETKKGLLAKLKRLKEKLW